MNFSIIYRHFIGLDETDHQLVPVGCISNWKISLEFKQFKDLKVDLAD